LGTYTVAYETMEPRLFAMERHMGISKSLGMMGTMGKIRGGGGGVNAKIEVSHKYSWRFGTYKVDLPVGSRHRNNRTHAKRGSIST
jgi:hypothetical protein